MKRYLIFKAHHNQPMGGALDFMADVDSLLDAINFDLSYGRVSAIDTNTRQIYIFDQSIKSFVEEKDEDKTSRAKLVKLLLSCGEDVNMYNIEEKALKLYNTIPGSTRGLYSKDIYEAAYDWAELVVGMGNSLDSVWSNGSID